MWEPLLALGFQAPQGPATSLLFCGPPSLGDRFPDIVASYGDQRVICLDLHVEVRDGRVRTADFEGRPVADLLERLGHRADAEALRAALGGPTGATPADVSAAVALLFADPPT